MHPPASRKLSFGGGGGDSHYYEVPYTGGEDVLPKWVSFYILKKVRR